MGMVIWYKLEFPAAGLLGGTVRVSNDVLSGDYVTDAEITTYYTTHKTQYGTAASRDVRHILVNNKKLADSIEAKLKSGGNFAVLAKKYSKDPGSAKTGGKLTITKGQTVPEFDKTAFALKTNQISAPVHTQYGWHIIQALSAIKPSKVTPFKSTSATIIEAWIPSASGEEDAAEAELTKRCTRRRRSRVARSPTQLR